MKKPTSIEIARTWTAQRPDLDLSDFVFELYATRLGRLIEQFQDRDCRERYGLGASHMRVLTALLRMGEPYAATPSDLYQNTLVTASAITKQVDRLILHGLVVRTPDPANGRYAIVRLTEEGIRVAREIITTRASSSVIKPVLARIAPEHRAIAADVMRAVLESLEASDEGPSPDE